MPSAVVKRWSAQNVLHAAAVLCVLHAAGVQAVCVPGEYNWTQACLPCEAGNWCDGELMHACGVNAGSAPLSSSAEQCFCMPGHYGSAGSNCTACPVGCHSAAGARAVHECMCSAGTFGNVSGEPGFVCQTCSMGHFCPGDGTEHVCPLGWRTEPAAGSSLVGQCRPPACGNGVLEPGEQCDDGGRFSGDGCDGFCRLEDSCGCASGAQWVCSLEAFGKTECCRSLLNPVTGEYVCSCAGQASDSTAYVVRKDCTKLDVNECDTDNGGCHADANCMNLDGTVEGGGTYKCSCPPGMLGDGVRQCSIFLFETLLNFALEDTSKEEVEAEAADLTAALVHDTPFFPNKTQADVTVGVEDPGSGASGRRSLGNGTSGGAASITIRLVVTSMDALEMEGVTSATDREGIRLFLINWFQTAVEAVAGPDNAVQTVDAVYGTVRTVMTGFDVSGVVYNATALEWLVSVSYTPDSPNTVTSLYVTRSGDPPYGQRTRDSFFMSKHPCMQSTSVCCMRAYRENYYVGAFAGTVASAVGACDADVQARDTLSMFSPSDNDATLLGALSELNYSYVTRTGADTLDMHINRFALRDRIAMRTAVAGGYDMHFFVGMSYFTLLPTNAVVTVASQVAVRARATDSLVFATVSEQDYSLLDYITMDVFETKYVPDLLTEHRLQFAKVGFVLPDGVRQNTQTGLVPLTSIRFAVASVLPSVTDEALWTNPCYSADGSGLFDNASAPLRTLFTLASHQQCALQPDFCRNPEGADLSSGLVEFWVPLGDSVIGSDVQAAVPPLSLFVYFDVSVVDGNARSTTKLFSQATLSSMAITRACQEVEAASSINDVVEVDLDVGMAGLREDWNGSVTSFRDLLRQTGAGGSGYTDVALNVQASSMQAGLITIVVRGSDALFKNPQALDFHVEIEDMLTLHFLERSRYTAMLQLLSSGNVWEMVRHDNTGFLELALTQAAQELCANETIPGDFTCAARRNIYRRQVVAAHAAHALATGVGTHDEEATVAWLEEHILRGRTDFTRELARNFTRLSRAAHGVNDRYKKAWFVNPMYQWSAAEGAPAQSILSLTDYTIILAVVTLDDANYAFGSGGGVGRRRVLLEIGGSGGSFEQRALALSERGGRRNIPPMRNSAVDADREIARMVGIEQQAWVKTGMELTVEAPQGVAARQVRDEIQQRLAANMPRFVEGGGHAYLVQFLMKPAPSGSNGQRRASADGRGLVPWTGTVNLMWTQAQASSDFDATHSRDVYFNWLHCALWLADLETDQTGAPKPDCGQRTTEGISGFVERFWVDTCNQYSTDIENCTAVLQKMESEEALQAVRPEAPVVEDNSELVEGYHMSMTLIDPHVNANTFTQWNKDTIRSIVAEEFNVTSAQVVLDKTSSTPLRRRLLDVHTVWVVYVPKDYTRKNVSMTVRENVISRNIAREMNFAVKVDVRAASVVTDGELDTSKPEASDVRNVDKGYPLVMVLVPTVFSCVLTLGIIIQISRKSFGRSSTIDPNSMTETASLGDHESANPTSKMAQASATYTFPGDAVPVRGQSAIESLSSLVE